MSDSLYELEINDVNEPDECGVDLWIGKTAVSELSIEISVTGILHAQSESLSSIISKSDAIKLAKTILNACI